MMNEEKTTQVEQAEVAPEPKPAKKPKAKKAAKPKPGTDGELTMLDLAERYLAKLEADGKSQGTLFSYRMELKLALDAIGEKARVRTLKPAKVREFFDSDVVNKTRTGVPKSPLSIAKTQRVLRQALTHAVELGVIEKAPLPE
jgi:hypothetical protein